MTVDEALEVVSAIRDHEIFEDLKDRALETLAAEVRRLREELKEAKGKNCEKCSGSGMIASPGTGFYDCPACNGRGY